MHDGHGEELLGEGLGSVYSDTEPVFVSSVMTSNAPRTLVNSIPMTGTPFIAPFVPCSPDIAVEALNFANVGDKDVLVDLGNLFSIRSNPKFDL